MSTDEQLMERYVATGDARAFAELYTRHLPLIRRVVRRHVARPSEVDDLTQHTFMKLHSARSGYLLGARLKPWLCAIAINACRDLARRERRRPEAHVEIELLPAPAPCESTYVEGRSLPLLAAVEALPPKTRELVRLHYFEERSLAEIARSLDEKASTVRVRLHRGCRRLHAELAAC